MPFLKLLQFPTCNRRGHPLSKLFQLPTSNHRGHPLFICCDPDADLYLRHLTPSFLTLRNMQQNAIFFDDFP
jgi:hypothetical protein